MNQNFKLKKVAVVVLLFISAATALGIAIPKVFLSDAKNISKEDINCGQDAAYQIISENSIESLLTTKVIVRDKIQEIAYGKQQPVVYTDSYTWFGIKYATVAAICNSKTGTLVCAGRAYKIWQNIKSNPTMPCG
ncbi:MAG: hypothetical protein KME12_13665 [Trichocoleus desertorum ATA4-8-CV12]|jgi:hypothetical protein|nr:hypothetical protein [Trichocoleus desertorum ATA4-8-CV12]